MPDQLEDFVTAAEIGRRLGVTRQRASQLGQREDFPPPIGKIGNYVVWRWTDVEPWATAWRATRKKPPASSDA